MEQQGIARVRIVLETFTPTFESGGSFTTDIAPDGSYLFELNNILRTGAIGHLSATTAGFWEFGRPVNPVPNGGNAKCGCV